MPIDVNLPFVKLDVGNFIADVSFDCFYTGNGFNGYPFYHSCYPCPICKRKNMFKTVCKIGKEPRFILENNSAKKILAKRLFTCPDCNSVIIAEPGKRLDDLSYVYGVKFSNDNYYWNFIDKISELCTFEGRPDL